MTIGKQSGEAMERSFASATLAKYWEKLFRAADRSKAESFRPRPDNFDLLSNEVKMKSEKSYPFFLR